ncbi:MAG: type II toxin-antitoxin system VapC family toxin [Planctomycetaceae bacterium]
MRILIDTNILLRCVEPLHAQHLTSTNAVSVLRKDDHDLAIVPQGLYEFWSVATRPLGGNGPGLSVSDAQSELTALKRLFRLLRDERAVYAEWEHLVTTHDVKGKKAHDARLVAAMHRHAMTHVLSFNVGDFARYSSVIPLLPDDVERGTVRV